MFAASLCQWVVGRVGRGPEATSMEVSSWQRWVSGSSAQQRSAPILADATGCRAPAAPRPLSAPASLGILLHRVSPPTRRARLPSYSNSPQGTTLGPEENPVREATSLGHCAISGYQRCQRHWGHTAAWERGPTDTKSQGRVSLTPATHPVPLRMLEATSHSGQHPGLKSSTSCLPVGQQLLPLPDTNAQWSWH